jgi:hypothetical protein
MAIVMIGDFGKDEEGVRTYRINGDKADLERIIQESADLGYEFWIEPVIEKSWKTYTLLLKIYIPEEMGYPEEVKE